MKFEHIRVMNFENALRGMRHPKESYHLSDSAFGIDSIEYCDWDQEIAQHWADYMDLSIESPQYEDTFDKIDAWLINNGVLKRQEDYVEYAFIGPKDMKLAQQLIRGGSEHRKFLRQILVSVDITAPLYW